VLVRFKLHHSQTQAHWDPYGIDLDQALGLLGLAQARTGPEACPQDALLWLLVAALPLGNSYFQVAREPWTNPAGDRTIMVAEPAVSGEDFGQLHTVPKKRFRGPHRSWAAATAANFWQTTLVLLHRLR
jgi:hypothetical protein